VPVIGNTYAGAAIIGLSAILDKAQPGRTHFNGFLWLGAGSDAFALTVTEAIAARRDRAPHTRDYIARRTVIDYATYAATAVKLR